MKATITLYEPKQHVENYYVRNEVFFDGVTQVMAPTAASPYWIIWTEQNSERHCRFIKEDLVLHVQLEDAIEDAVSYREEESNEPVRFNQMSGVRSSHPDIRTIYR